MTTHSHFHFICQITALVQRQAFSIQPCSELIQKRTDSYRQDSHCSICTQGLCKNTRPPASHPFCNNVGVAYPEFHDHSVQRGNLRQHHSARPQMLVHGSPHVPEVQVVPRQQAGGKEWLAQEERDLAIKARGRTKASE